MTRAIINFLDGTAEISITETSSPGARMWFISDVDNVRKGFRLTSRSGDNWIADDFIEDGKLKTTKKTFEIVDGKLALVAEYRDSFSIDKQGNLARKFTLSLPFFDIKIKKVMLALRIV